MSKRFIDVEWPQPSGRDLLALLAIVVGGVAVMSATAGTREPPRAPEECVVSGSVVATGSFERPLRPFGGVRVGFVPLPATYDGADLFVERGVTDEAGEFQVSCAGVDLFSAVALRFPEGTWCPVVTDVVLDRGGRQGLYFELWEGRGSGPPLGLGERCAPSRGLLRR